MGKASDKCINGNVDGFEMILTIDAVLKMKTVSFDLFVGVDSESV